MGRIGDSHCEVEVTGQFVWRRSRSGSLPNRNSTFFTLQFSLDGSQVARVLNYYVQLLNKPIM